MPAAIPYVQDIRAELADVPPEQLSDETILTELVKAQTFLDPYKIDDEAFMRQCYVALATYYCYVAYTSLAERELGAVPATTETRLKELRRIAYMFVSQIAPVDEELRPRVKDGGVSVGELRESVLSDCI